MKAIFKISAISVVAVLCFSMGSYGQETADSVAVKAASEQTAPAKKKKKKLTKEEKQKIKDLDAVVTTARHKMSADEKERIERLTILEQDLQCWLQDIQSQWLCVGLIEIFPPQSEGEGGGRDHIYGELWIKRGSTFQSRIFYRGSMYEGQRWITLTTSGKIFRWRTKDYALTPIYYNIPDDIITDDGIPHPEYKNYNPWEYLIELDKKAGKVSQKVLVDIQKDFKESKKKLEKSKRNK